MSEELARAFCAGAIDFTRFYSATRRNWMRVFFQEQRRSHDGKKPNAVFDADDFAQVGLMAAVQRAKSFDPKKSDSAWRFLASVAVKSAKRAAAKARTGKVRAVAGAGQLERFTKLASVESSDYDNTAASWPAIIDFARVVKTEKTIFMALCAHRNLHVVAAKTGAGAKRARKVRARMIAQLSSR